jgi:hypothetical protein
MAFRLPLHPPVKATFERIPSSPISKSMREEQVPLVL